MANRNRPWPELHPPEGVLCPTPEATLELGLESSAFMTPGLVVSLEGPLGAGKTQFVKGVAAGLGCREPVSSPSFAIVHEYPGGRLPLYHFDFYRVQRPADLDALGFDEYLPAGIALVEWGGKFADLLPQRAWRVRFEILSPDLRRIIVEGTP